MPDEQLSEAELRVIRGLGISRDAYLARKQATARHKATAEERVDVLRRMARTCGPKEREAIGRRIKEVEEEDEY